MTILREKYPELSSNLVLWRACRLFDQIFAKAEATLPPDEMREYRARLEAALAAKAALVDRGDT